MFIEKYTPGCEVRGTVIRSSSSKGMELVLEGGIRAYMPENTAGRSRSHFDMFQPGHSLLVRVTERKKHEVLVAPRIRKLSEGEVFTGRIARVMEGRYFVMLEPFIDGPLSSNREASRGYYREKEIVGAQVRVKITQVREEGDGLRYTLTDAN